MPLGASLLDLLPLPNGAQAVIPAGVRGFLERFAAVDLTSSTTANATFHHGLLLPTVADTGIADAVRGWSIQGAGFDRGVPFQLACTRAAVVGNVEPPPAAFQLDLLLEQVSIVMPGLKAAVLVPGAGATPAHLEPDPASPPVRLVGNAVMRFVLAGGQLSGPVLVDLPDPLVPGATTGSVVSLQFSPPHFFVANSAVGLTVRKLTFDASTAFTPANIMARHHGPDWTGLAINEATLYLPRETPLVGSLVLGVRDVLLGDPFGLQGELRVQWGAGDAAATPVQVRQAQAGGDDAGYGRITVAPTGSSGDAHDRSVQIEPGRPLRFFAQVVSGPGTADTVRWVLPDGSRAQGLLTPEFRARAGDVLVCVRSETAEDGTQVEAPEIRHHFVAAPAAAPVISVTVGGTSHANVVHVSGARDVLAAAALVFDADHATVDAAFATWQLGDGPAAPVGRGTRFELDAGAAATLPASGRADLVLDDGSGRLRRVRIECLPQAALLIGAAAGVFDAEGVEQAVQAVERCAVLGPFHADGVLEGANETARGSGTDVQVGAGTLAQVTVAAVAPPPPVAARHERVRMVFDETNPSHEGEDIEAVQQLLARFPAGRLVLVGRCDDVGDAGYNAGLARSRAAALRERLMTLGVAGNRIVHRGEQNAGWSGLNGGSAPDEAALGIPAQQQGARWYAHEQEPGHPLPNSPQESADLRARREEYRRVDLHAEGEPAPDAALPPDEAALAGTLRRVWLPGPDGEPPAPLLAGAPELIHRVSVRVAWDNPTATTPADGVPTLAEVTVAYESERLSQPANLPAELPGTSVGAGSGMAGQPGNPAEVLTVTGRWTYDARSGETCFVASVDSTGDPLGLFHLDGDAVALAAAFGPAVVSAVSPAFDGAGAVSLAGAALAATVLQGAVKDGRVVCTGLAVEQRQRALDSLQGSRQQLLFDYVSEFNVDLSLLGGVLKLSTAQPVRIRYRDVGVQLDWSRTKWWEVASFVYEGIRMEVVEPGQWQIEGPLGRMLGIVAVRMGTGSTWFEVDMVFNLDLGVVRLTAATIRIVAEAGQPLRVEVRGLGLQLSVPGVLEGSGTARLDSSGELSADVAVDVVAAGLSARAQLALQALDGPPPYSFVAIRVSVLLPVGIPLANTGLGIFGFVGQFVSNGERTVRIDPRADPVQLELDWYAAAFADKWNPRKDQWALGLGVVIGTLPDRGFTFNAEGMFVVAFPDPSVVLGIDARLLAPAGQASDAGAAGAAGGSEFSLLGLAVLDPAAVMIGVRGRYEIPGVLELDVPLSAYFPLAGDPRGSYVHLGADNVTDPDKVRIHARAGDPVTMTLLPGVLDARTWSYFMLEERQLRWLGNDERFSFDGFSVGFGAGWHIEWQGGPVTLEASARLLVGLGTAPFKLVGGVAVEGLLDARIISVGVSGEIVAEVVEVGGTLRKHLSGEFCAEIDLPLVPPLEHCIGIEIGAPLTQPIPVPAHPLQGVDLTDRCGARVAQAASARSSAPAHTAWPDTVPVLAFSHVPEVGEGLEAAWTLAARPNNPSPWAGTSELKYAFRLDSVALQRRRSDGSYEDVPGPRDAVFWLPTHRGGVLGSGPDTIWPSEHEGAALALLSWVPFAVFRNLTQGGAGLPGDPVQTLGEVCDTVSIAGTRCAPGADAQPDVPGAVRIPSRELAQDPLAARFTVHGTATLGGLLWPQLGVALESLGLHARPGGVVRLARPITAAPGLRLSQGYELPSIGQPLGPPQCNVYASLGWVGRCEPALAEGRVLLEVLDQGFGVSAPTRCFPFETVGFVNNRRRWDTAGLRFVKTFAPEGASLLNGMGDSLQLGLGTVRMTLPFPVMWAQLLVRHDTLLPVTLTVKDLYGRVLDTRLLPRLNEEPYGIENLGPFSELVFVSADPEFGIDGVCVRAGLGPDDGPLPVPPLLGQRTDGSVAFWLHEVLSDTQSGGRRCLQVAYTPPMVEGAAAPWQAIGVPPMQSATVRVISVCGLTTTLQQVRVRDEAARDTLRDGWNLHAAGTAAPPLLLRPDSDYRVRVAMSWAGWRPQRVGEQPPATVAASAWQPLDTVDWHFHTAALAIDRSGSPPDVSMTDESRFDPRAVARYVIGFEPDGAAGAAPHFLDDELRLHLSSHHTEPLLGVYNFALQLVLRRTDPPAGSTVGGPQPSLPLQVRHEPLDAALLDRVDARVIASVKAGSTCLSGEVSTGGETLAITAALEPGAAYDLALVAPPRGDPGDHSLLLARVHFRSSRHPGVAALMADLGFDAAAPALQIPLDAVVTAAAMPAADAQPGDAALEEALSELGLDPWPVVDFGRAVVLWRLDAAGAWRLAGALLEAPEPLERGARCSVVELRVLGAGPAVTLRPCRRNTAGTRVLLSVAGDAGGVVLRDAALTLELAMLDRGRTLLASRHLRAQPRIAYQELI